ncbi:MAG TPA: hypothetical protein VEB40_11560 [Flavipsychrobacter sp.]|nr:hypothetical protein [Flavipsychrobacter sp.]
MMKRLYQAGYLVYGMLVLAAVFFYKERTILLDNSLFLFDMLKDDTFCIQRNRFIVVLPQLLPMLAAKLSLSLKWVMIAYSAGYMLYHFGCYCLCGLLKNYRMGIALLLVNTLIVAHAFFWHLSELSLGISLLFPFFALFADVQHKLARPVQYVLMAAGLVTIVFSHPLIVFPLFFISAFLWLSKKIVVDKRQLFAVCLVFLTVLVLKTIFFADSYETDSAGLVKNFISLFPGYFSTYSNTRFFSNWFYIFYWLPVLFIIVSAFYAMKRQWLKLILVSGACIAYSQVVNISYPGYNTPDFYWENMYTALCVFLALPMVYDLFPALSRWKAAVPALCLLIVCTALLRINMLRHDYRGRIDWYRGYLDRYRNEKMMVTMYNKPQETIIMEWASPYEFWLLSTLEKDTTASIIIHKNVEEVGWAWENYRAFVTTWGVYPYKDLNPQYFKFRDTTRHYSVYNNR